MDLTQLVAIFTIIGMLFAATTVIIKRNDKKTSLIANSEIEKSQEACKINRGATMDEIKKRIQVLETSDISKQLAIVRMETTLETLTQAHEKTQTMILEQGAQFHDITSELIQTIQGMNK
jgi:hypothetical protein